jgi:hypothetical protein
VKPSAKKVLVIGVVCGVLAVTLVRAGVALLMGGVKALILIALVGFVWLVLGRRTSRSPD